MRVCFEGFSAGDLARIGANRLHSFAMNFGDLAANELQFVAHNVEINYKKPAFINELSSISAKEASLGRSYVDFEQENTTVIRAIVRPAP